jgi:Bacteriophage Sf6, terminase small subunit-like
MNEYIEDIDPSKPMSYYIDRANKFRREQERIKSQRTPEQEAEYQAEQAKEKSEYDKKASLVYSEKIAQEICERISAGELLINITNLPHMPTLRRCNQWLKANDDFMMLYKESIQDRLSIFEEEVISIADDAAKDWREIIQRNGETRKVIDSEVIARAKLRVEVRFRHLKAGRPQKWGDSSTLNVKTSDSDLDATGMSTDELERRIADIESKSRIVRIVR